LVLYMPYDYPFVMDEDMCWFISQYVNSKDTHYETWKMTREEGLKCITCAEF